MEGVANVATVQQQKISSKEAQGRATQVEQPKQFKQQNIVKELQKEVSQTDTKINSKEQVQELVDQLNTALAPISTNVRFGVDSQDIFYVSVIDNATSKLLRRFPAEQAADFLPKMQEVTGILFDTKG